MSVQLQPGISLITQSQALRVSSQDPLHCLSSAVVGGGFIQTRNIINLHVKKGYDNPRPTQDLDRYANKIGIKTPYVGLMTAAFPDQAQTSTLTQDGIQVSAVITSGVSNASAAGDDPPVAAPPEPGTINIILILSRRLSRAAMVNAVITATEAKTGVLRDLKMKTPGNLPATGTSTDSIVIACRQESPRIPYAGPLTIPGYLMAKTIRNILTQQLS